MECFWSTFGVSLLKVLGCGAICGVVILVINALVYVAVDIETNHGGKWAVLFALSILLAVVIIACGLHAYFTCF